MKIGELNWEDFVVPVLAFLLIINSGLQLFGKKNSIVSENEIKEYKEEKRKFVVEAIIGFFIMGISMWAALFKNDKITDLVNTNNNLEKQVSKLTDSVSKVNSAVNDIGLKLDINTGKLSVIDSQLLKNKFLKVINYKNNFFSISAPDSGKITQSKNVPEEQRHITDTLLNRIKTIPKDFPITMTYNVDKETAAFAAEIKRKLISMGYRVVLVTPSIMGGYPGHDAVVIIEASRKEASVDVFEKSYTF